MSSDRIHITSASIRRDRPPRATLFFDLRVRGDAGGPRWLVIPTRTDQPSALDHLRTDGVEAYALRGGATLIGRFQGTTGFYAIPIPTHGELVIRKLALSTWGAIPTAVELATADDVRIGGEPVSAWLGGARVEPEEAVFDEAAPTHSRHTEDRHEVEVLLTGLAKHSLAL